jgi:hypothetical protein
MPIGKESLRLTLALCPAANASDVYIKLMSMSLTLALISMSMSMSMLLK